MKGIIFTEFLDFIEAEHGYETVDAILEKTAPPSKGAYTAVGNYDFAEMAALTSEYSKHSGRPVPEILRSFGRQLFGRFHEIYPLSFGNCHDPLDFLETVERRIHKEVVKLYPDARIPQLNTERLDTNSLMLTYRSCRPLGQLCLGMIEACGDHFGVRLDIKATPSPNGLDIIVRKAKADAVSSSDQMAAQS